MEKNLHCCGCLVFDARSVTWSAIWKCIISGESIVYFWCILYSVFLVCCVFLVYCHLVEVLYIVNFWWWVQQETRLASPLCYWPRLTPLHDCYLTATILIPYWYIQYCCQSAIILLTCTATVLLAQLTLLQHDHHTWSTLGCTKSSKSCQNHVAS